MQVYPFEGHITWELFDMRIKPILCLLLVSIIAMCMATAMSEASGRWVVCIKAETVQGPLAINQICYRCALADSGGPMYVNPVTGGNPCASSPGAQWRSFRTRTDAVWWMEKNCGCRSSTSLPAPEQ
jgi:hypothetical protein